MRTDFIQGKRDDLKRRIRDDISSIQGILDYYSAMEDAENINKYKKFLQIVKKGKKSLQIVEHEYNEHVKDKKEDTNCETTSSSRTSQRKRIMVAYTPICPITARRWSNP